jgi:hypothetical protein
MLKQNVRLAHWSHSHPPNESHLQPQTSWFINPHLLTKTKPAAVLNGQLPVKQHSRYINLFKLRLVLVLLLRWLFWRPRVNLG